jgi:hypothetical protein
MVDAQPLIGRTQRFSAFIEKGTGTVKLSPSKEKTSAESRNMGRTSSKAILQL